ncbi:MAG TPA: DNA gyrase subunit A [Candidatus Thermoplasmatota archaeon]|nr:DNA gyrase subunit A [Candidatus Thermoplasmatota archaeon]
MVEEPNPDTIPNGGHGTLVDRPIESEMRTAYIDYAMSVIVGRALPDARDGLKPVHRRILYAMQELGLTADKAHKKSARVVGEVLGKYHPHGDSAVYDTMVRMAQDFSLRYPLVDGQGNFGSVDGDNAAAMRYTEARLSRIAGELLEDLDKETVDFAPNFDASLEEPTVLPAKLPNLLVNGSSGIAVGMATNMPPHNLGEIVDALKALAANPDISIAELVKLVPGPDFPTGGIIQGRSGILQAYATGRGVIRVRAKHEIEEMKGDRERLVFTELPYMVNKANLLAAIADLVKEKKLEGISDLRDESDREGMRMVIELKRDAVTDVVLNNLFKHTQLEASFGILNLALVDNQPRVLTLKGLLEEYLGHRTVVVTRRTQFLLKKAEARLHIVKGLLLAVGERANLDKVIRIIRESADPDAARAALVAEEYLGVGLDYVGTRLDDEQAKAILDMRLSKLTGLEVRKLREEAESLHGQILDYEDILAKPERVKAIIVAELDELRGTYADARRTAIVDAEGEIQVEDLIPDEHVVVTITNDGYIKRIPLNTYRAQRRGGKGLVGMQTKEEDYVVDLFVTTTHRYILFFTNVGKVYWLKAWQIPEGSRQGKGKAIVNLLEGLEQGEVVEAAVPVAEFAEDKYLFFATRNGTVKKTSLAEYSRPRTSGIIALGLDEGDALVGVRITGGSDDIILAKAQGQSIRFSEADVRPMGRPATGVRGVSLDAGDRVVSLAVIRDPAGQLLTVTENGYGKRTVIEEYRLQHRGGSGIITIQTTERNGRVVAVREVREVDEILVTSEGGMVIRVPVSTISVLGRNVQGNRIMRLDEGDKVRALAVLMHEDVAEADLEAQAAALASEPRPGPPAPPSPFPLPPDEPEPAEPDEEE